MAEPSSSNPATTTTTEPPSSSSSPPTTPQCAQCALTPSSLKPCNKCHTTLYCTKDCQKAHYRSHKKVCASLAQAYMQTHKVKMAGHAVPRSTDRNTGYKKWEFDT